jgi:hypothetical protein
LKGSPIPAIAKRGHSRDHRPDCVLMQIAWLNSQGRFKQIQFRVKDTPIVVTNLVVAFANDQTFSPKIRHLFAEGSGFHLIYHPGERRTINRINFNYKSISRREGKGLVKVLAG